MTLRSDRRGAALQVGAVLLLGFLVIALSLYQATVVPAQNERVEFRHSQQVQTDMVEVRNALQRAGTSGDVQSVAVDLGTTYPPRVFFVNPPPPGGLVHNGTPGTVTFGNARATDDETADFLNASANGPYTLTTKAVSYRPSYHVYGNAPTTSYQSGVLVNELAEGNDTAISGQALVRGSDLYLVAIRGNLSRAGIRSYTVDPASVSTATESTTIRNTTGGNVTVTVPTTLSAERWRDLLGEEYDPDDSSDEHHVHAVTGTSDGVRLELDGGTTYRLRTALVGVGTGTERPGAAYLARADPDGGADVAVEVRDRFNNPVANSRVGGNLTVTVTSGTDVLDPDTVTVGEDGRAEFTYAGTTGTATLRLQSDGSPHLDAANGSVTVEVTDADLSGGAGGDDTGGNINPPDELILTGSSIVTSGGPGPSVDRAEVTLENVGGEDLNVTSARFNFYYRDSQGGTGVSLPGSVEVRGETLNKGGEYVDLSIAVPAGGRETLTLTFYNGADGGGGTYDVDAGDFFVVSVVIDGGENTATYFVAPE